MFTPAPGKPYIEPKITVNDARLDVVDTLYLGSPVSRDSSLDTEIYSRISKASIVFEKLEKRVWVDHDIIIKSKINVYRTCVSMVPLYSAETWTRHKRHLKLLEHFHQKCLRDMLNIKWQTYTPDTTVLEIAECPNIEYFIMLNQLRWAGHLVCMEDTRIPKQLFLRRTGK